MKRIFALLLLFTILVSLALCGCGADATQESVAATPDPTVTAVATPAPTPSPTAEPMPSPSVAATSTDLQTQLTDAPEIDGLTKAIQDGSVVYTYNEENPYGGTAGEYAGVYKENVFVEGEQVGGVCLSADVCLVLLNNALAEILEGEDKIKAVVPLDISIMDGTDTVDIFSVYSKSSDVPAVMVNASSYFDVLSGLPYSDQQFATPMEGGQLSLSSDKNGDFVFDSVPLYNNYIYGKQFDSNEAMHFLNYGIPNGDVSLDYNVIASIGESLGFETDSILLFLNDSKKAYSLDTGDLLSLNGKVVFITTKIIEQ